MLTTVNTVPLSNSSNQEHSKTNKNKSLSEENKKVEKNENDMMVDNSNISVKENEALNIRNDNNRPSKKNKDSLHFYNRNTNSSSKGYKSNYRNQNKLNHKNSNSSMMSDFSNNGRYYNGSRGGNKKSRSSYSNSGNNNSNNGKKPTKDIKDIQKKLDKKLNKKLDKDTNQNTFITPNSIDVTINNDNTIQTQLDLDNFDPKILEKKEDSPPLSPESNEKETDDIQNNNIPIENEDVIMDMEEEEQEEHVDEEESDFLNGFSSDKIENAGKIFIGGLTYDTTDEKLREHFEQYGKITECTVMKDNNGCSRGFGFITYENPEVLDKVLEINHILDGKTIDPKRAIPRDRQDKTEKIFVGGIHPDVTEAEFKEAFDSYGKVIDATLITAKDTGKSRCFGFITYEDGRGVEAAYADRHNIVLNGKKVEVKHAAPKPKGSINPMMVNMNNMNMRLPMGMPMSMGVINMPPQPPQQPHMPPPKIIKNNSASSAQYSPKNKQAQKYYQQNLRSGQVGPIRNQHNHAYPQDFQYSRYNLNMNMNMYTTYNYPYSMNNPAGFVGYEYDNYNLPPMAGYGNPQPYPNSAAPYPSGYINRNMGSYPYSGSNSSNGSSSSHSNYNGHGSGRNSNGGSSNYYRNNHSNGNNQNSNALSMNSGNPQNYIYNGYGMNIYNNGYVPYNGPAPIARINSNSSSSSSNGGNMGYSRGSNANHNSGKSNNSHSSISISENGNDDNEMNNTSLYMGVNSRNNHGYHPYSRN